MDYPCRVLLCSPEPSFLHQIAGQVVYAPHACRAYDLRQCRRLDHLLVDVQALEVGKAPNDVEQRLVGVPDRPPGFSVSPVSERDLRLLPLNQAISSLSIATLANGKGEIESCSMVFDVNDGRASPSKCSLVSGSLVLIASFSIPSRTAPSCKKRAK